MIHLWDEGPSLERTRRELHALRVVEHTWWQRNRESEERNKQREAAWVARRYPAAYRRDEPEPDTGTRIIGSTLVACLIGLLLVGIDFLVLPRYGFHHPMGVAADLGLTALITTILFIGSSRR